MARVHPIRDERIERGTDGLDVLGGHVRLERRTTEGRHQAPGREVVREPLERHPTERAEREGHTGSTKKAASGVATVGTTRARSSSSLRRSQLVSAMRRQP